VKKEDVNALPNSKGRDQRSRLHGTAGRGFAAMVAMPIAMWYDRVGLSNCEL
jgi:hypothetical protein